LKNAGKLVPDDLVGTFISRRVLPLQTQIHKICQMSGFQDPTRITTIELTNGKITRKVQAIAKIERVDEWEWGLEAYSQANPAPAVRSLCRHNLILFEISCTDIGR
jgi:hypothetical protein